MLPGQVDVAVEDHDLFINWSRLRGNPNLRPHSWHRSIRISYARDLYQRGIIRIKHIGTDNMPADAFTKPLGAEKFIKFRKILLNI